MHLRDFKISLSAIALLLSLSIPSKAANQNAGNNAKSDILKTVVITGTFASWEDTNHFKDWKVSVIRPSDYSDPKDLKFMKRKNFPVSPDGSFRIVLHDVPKGDGYYLESRAGSQRFWIFSDKVIINVIGPDSAE